MTNGYRFRCGRSALTRLSVGRDRLVNLARAFLTPSLTAVSIKLVRAQTRQAVAALCVVSGFGLAACGSSARHTSTAAQVPTPTATTNVAETLSTSSTKTTSRPGGHPKTVKKTSGDSGKTTSTSATTTDPVNASTTTSVRTSSKTTSAKQRRPHPYVPAKAPPIVPSSESRSVLACLARSGVTHISQGSNTLWSGYDLKTGTFVFVYLYPIRPGGHCPHALPVTRGSCARRAVPNSAADHAICRLAGPGGHGVPRR